MFGVQSVLASGTEARLISVSGQVEQEGDGILLLGCSLGEADDRCQRVQGAISASDLTLPDRLVTVEVTPRDPKPMAVDLAIAVAALGASGRLPRDTSQGWVFYAALDAGGRLQPAPGVPAVVPAMRSAAARAVVIAAANSPEAASGPGVEVIAAETLAEVIARLRQGVDPALRDRRAVPGCHLGVSQ